MVDGQGPVVVSVINMKGGVGKTTVAAMLARWMTSMPPFVKPQTPSPIPGPIQGACLDTLAVDLDPQANLSQALMGAKPYTQFLNEQSSSIVDVFRGYHPATQSNPSPRSLDVSSVVRPLGGSSLELIPSRFDFSDNLINSTKPDPTVLARLIADNFQYKDLIIIDCAPTESILTQAAYHASRYILIPVKPEFLATIGFPLLQDSLAKFKSSNPMHQIDVIGVVINDTFDYQSDDETPEKRDSLEEISEEAKKNDWHIFDKRLEYSRGFPKIMRGNFSQLGDAPALFTQFAYGFRRDIFEEQLMLLFGNLMEVSEFKDMFLENVNKYSRILADFDIKSMKKLADEFL